MPFLPSRYEPSLVVVSIAIATFASYVALDLAKRMRGGDRGWQRHWWTGGSIALGTGIWSMHFIGMLAFSLPIPLGYSPALTLVSFFAAVAASAVALFFASRQKLDRRSLAAGATTMGAGIFAMHYIGMAALDMAPGITWNPLLVGTSLGVAIATSAAALQIFFWLRKVSEHGSLRHQVMAAALMGLAISGMHYTGMSAASFPLGSVCLSAGALRGAGLGALVGLSAMTLLGLTLLTSIYDARMQSQAAKITASLQVANTSLREKRERFRALVALSSDWFWEQDDEHRFTAISAGFELALSS
ncbi:MAG: MHYT domain-containing protein, partial [Caldimonas sp.]